MAEALYGPDGFYTSGRGSAGRRGDFITSPEVGPLFGAVVGRWLDSVWDDLGRPDPFVVFDLGSGPGTLPKAIMRSTPRCGEALQLSGVDISSSGDLPSDLRGSVIVANELLDNVPFRWIRNREEAFVEGGALLWKPTVEAVATGDYPLIEQAAALVSGLLDRGSSASLLSTTGRYPARSWPTAVVGFVATGGTNVMRIHWFIPDFWTSLPTFPLINFPGRRRS